MAFSTTELQYAQSLVNTMYDQGYEYYVAYTNTTVNSGYNYVYEPDLYIIFSKEKITALDLYSFSAPSGSLKYTIRASDYSTSSYAVNTDRVVVDNFSGSFSVNVYEHIYTNAVFSSGSIQPDLRFLEGGAEIEKTNSLGLVVTLTLLFIIIFTILRFK